VRWERSYTSRRGGRDLTPHGEIREIRHLKERWEKSDTTWKTGRDFTTHEYVGEICHYPERYLIFHGEMGELRRLTVR
jgi:hypothetical protein